MFTHVMIASNDLERARDFYDATFAALGRLGSLSHQPARKQSDPLTPTPCRSNGHDAILDGGVGSEAS